MEWEVYFRRGHAQIPVDLSSLSIADCATPMSLTRSFSKGAKAFSCEGENGIFLLNLLPVKRVLVGRTLKASPLYSLRICVQILRSSLERDQPNELLMSS